MARIDPRTMTDEELEEFMRQRMQPEGAMPEAPAPLPPEPAPAPPEPAPESDDAVAAAAGMDVDSRMFRPGVAPERPARHMPSLAMRRADLVTDSISKLATGTGTGYDERKAARDAGATQDYNDAVERFTASEKARKAASPIGTKLGKATGRDPELTHGEYQESIPGGANKQIITHRQDVAKGDRQDDAQAHESKESGLDRAGTMDVEKLRAKTKIEVAKLRRRSGGGGGGGGGGDKALAAFDGDDETLATALAELEMGLTTPRTTRLMQFAPEHPSVKAADRRGRGQAGRNYRGQDAISKSAGQDADIRASVAHFEKNYMSGDKLTPTAAQLMSDIVSSKRVEELSPAHQKLLSASQNAVQGFVRKLSGATMTKEEAARIEGLSSSYFTQKSYVAPGGIAMVKFLPTPDSQAILDGRRVSNTAIMEVIHRVRRAALSWTAVLKSRAKDVTTLKTLGDVDRQAFRERATEWTNKYLASPESRGEIIGHDEDLPGKGEKGLQYRFEVDGIKLKVKWRSKGGRGEFYIRNPQ